MKKIPKLYTILTFLTAVSIASLYSQNSRIEYNVDLSSYASTKNTLPFWLVSNKYDIVPNSNNAILKTTFFSDFKRTSKKIDISYKASFIGYTEKNNNHIFINELYTSIKYNKIQLDLGVKHPDVLFEGLSSSNGNIAHSTNSRSFPGYNLQIPEFTELPFAKKWLSFKGNYADYLLNDTRVVDNARLHTKSLYFKSRLSSKIEIITGLNHYVQWGGTSPTFGKQPSSFKDYLKIVRGASGGSGARIGDQINALGNHLGSYLFQLNSYGKTNWSFYYSHPFEDTSGREMQNWRDGLYGFFIDFKKTKKLVTHLSVEFTYTKHMSGNSNHYTDSEGVAHVARGRDNYFNNGTYASGWTYFGNTIGSPYFTPNLVNEDGITNGVIIGDNRFRAFNIGLKGYIGNFEYRSMISHTTYFGYFDDEYSPKPQQISTLLEFKLPKINHLPFNISFGTGFDTGTYRPVNFGGYLKISKMGLL